MSIALMIAAVASIDPGCDMYHGTLTTTWPDGSYQLQSGILSDYPYISPYATFFNFNGVDYVVPNTAISAYVVNDSVCTFRIAYDGDPIFASGFER